MTIIEHHNDTPAKPRKPRAVAVAKASQELAPVSEASSLIAAIERAARDPSVDLDKFERLMAMSERINARNAEQAFNEALAAAQHEMRPVAADASNPQTRSKYASYLALDKAMRPIYTRHGFALSFNTAEGAPEGCIRVVCSVSHQGHTQKYQLDMPADGKGAKGGDVMTKTHAVGSGISYAQRYLLKMIFNISVGDDDDGNAAGNTAERITPEQLAQIEKLAGEVGADIGKACRHLKIETLANLPANRFNAAMQALEAKRSPL